MRSVVIMGSSRSNGDTAKIVEKFREFGNFDLIDLNLFKFSYYDYRQLNLNDDFIPLMKRIILNYDTIIFATPVYWYSMSGIMKVFFDRITDLLDSEKELGRKLRGKKMAALSCSLGDHLGDAFWLPFAETARYLGMEYTGGLHTRLNENQISKTESANIKAFAAQLQNRTSN